MKKQRAVVIVLTIVGVLMISMALVLINENSTRKSASNIKFESVDVRSVAASANMVINKEKEEDSLPLAEVEMETVPASVIIPPRIEVYDGLTIEELAAKFDRLLGNGYMAGRGYTIAQKSLDYGVDPYVALAIILHETGCGGNNSCSRLVITCNNVGGQKGSPGCNGGAFKAFASLDEGIEGFVGNLYRNYYAVGLTTIDSIAPKYAEGNTWASKIHWYVDKIRNS